MSGTSVLTPAFIGAGQIREARVVAAVEGGDVTVRLEGAMQVLACQVLHAGSHGARLFSDDRVLVWRADETSRTGVVLGTIGPYTEPAEAVASAAQIAARPQQLVLEAQGDIVLRNSHAKLTLSADGDVEVVCNSHTTRSHRILRLLAPLIKLN